jgi:hypothetical protein
MAKGVPPEGPWVNLSVSLRLADKARATEAARAAGLMNPVTGEPNVSEWARGVLLRELDGGSGL